MSLREPQEGRDRRYITEEDLARAAELLADFGMLVGPDGGWLPPVVRDAVNQAVAENRTAELIVGMVHVIDGTWPGVLGRDDVQTKLRLTAINCRESLGPAPESQL